MSYTILKTITVKRNRLTESLDLTKPLSAFVQTESYLVVTQNRFAYPLSLGRIINFVPGLDLTQPLTTVFSILLNDVFVNHFKDDTIPVMIDNAFYRNRLNVFNPIAYKDYQVHFTSVNTPNIRDDMTKKGFLDDLAIVSDADMSQYLVAVNGVFHRTTYLNGVLYVIDGFRTMRISGRKDVLVVDTRTIGGHTIIPLTKDNVTKSAYQQPAMVSLNTSIAGKTVFAVIDGYFYHRDLNVVSVADEKHLKLHANKMPLIQQFRHNPRTMYKVDRYGTDAPQSSRQRNDPYDTTFINRSSVSTSVLANAEFQYSRLTAYHSFLVVMNNPNLFTLTTDIIPTGTPQMYEEQSKRTVSGMLSYGCGLSPTYLIWKDPSERKTIFLPKQDYDRDWQDQSLSPSFIPSIISDPLEGVNVFAKFFDYVSA